jgi:hypothetical protein
MEDRYQIMDKSLPRDRWVGASPGLNVTPGGKGLEALANLLNQSKFDDISYLDVCNAIEEVGLEIPEDD